MPAAVSDAQTLQVGHRDAAAPSLGNLKFSEIPQSLLSLLKAASSLERVSYSEVPLKYCIILHIVGGHQKVGTAGGGECPVAIHESGFLASRHFQPLHYILIGVHDRRGLSSAVNDTWPVVKPSPEAASWVVRSPFVRVKAAPDQLLQPCWHRPQCGPVISLSANLPAVDVTVSR